MKKLTLYILIACIAVLLIPAKASAGFGVSPSAITNDTLMGGSQMVKEFVISRSDPYEDMEATITPDLGEINEWVTFVPGNKILLPAGEERVTVKAIINVPVGAVLNDYLGYFRIAATPTMPDNGVAVVSGARVDLHLATTSDEVMALSVRTAEVPDTYEDETLVLSLGIQNDGNTAAAPSKVMLEVQDLQENNIVDLETTDIDLAEPYEFSTVGAKFTDHGLSAGEYFGLVAVYDEEELLFEDRLVFNVLPAKVYKEVCTGATEAMEDNQNTYFYLAAGFGVVLAALVLYLVWRDQEDEKRNMKMVVVGIGLLIYLAVAYLIIMQDYFGKFERTCTQELVTAPAAAGEAEEEAEEEVQGASVKEAENAKKNVEVVDSLRVGLATQDGKYRVYAEDDLSTKVIYLAQEGEELVILEEKASWYRIETPEGAGWLPKSNVKVN